MREPIRVGVVAFVGVGFACGPTIRLDDTDQATEGLTTTSVGPAPATTVSPPPPPQGTTAQPGDTTAPPPGDTLSDESTDDSSFIINPDGWGPTECDLFAQDCPRGEKCASWANDGGSTWNATRCVPVVEDPGIPGDPCIMEGSAVSGIDTCELGAMCFYVDPDTLEGVCIAMCVGDPGNPTCEDPDSVCVITGSGAIIPCLPLCDPVEQDCFEGLGCYPFNDDFFCTIDFSEDMGAAGDPCDFRSACDPGTHCAIPGLVPGCEGGLGCCTSFCDLADPTPPCLPGQVCEPYYGAGSTPRGYEHVGACRLP